MDMDISMDIHAKSVDMDMDMDGKYHIHGNPVWGAFEDIFCPIYCSTSVLGL